MKFTSCILIAIKVWNVYQSNYTQHRALGRVLHGVPGTYRGHGALHGFCVLLARNRGKRNESSAMGYLCLWWLLCDLFIYLFISGSRSETCEMWARGLVMALCCAREPSGFRDARIFPPFAPSLGLLDLSPAPRHPRRRRLEARESRRPFAALPFLAPLA